MTETNEKTIAQPKMQASNIDEQGNVLFLDQERLDSKLSPAPRFKNHPNGIGLYNFLKEHVIYVSNKSWAIAGKLYRMFVGKAKWLSKNDFKGKAYKKFIMLYPEKETNTGTVVMPLNVDISDGSEKVILPVDMLKESLKKIDYIAGMNVCLCREAHDCKDYPHDLGCIFLGEAAKTAVRHELGKQITYEEACARIDRAAELGLMAQSVWIECEQLLWGIRNDQLDHFLEVCFCCQCCCITMQLAKHLPEKQVRFHPSGWTAVPDRTKCVGCGKCVNDGLPCALGALSIAEDGKVSINQDLCVGCGHCVHKCPLQVIKIKQTMPMREDLQTYFDKEFNVGLHLTQEEP